MDPETGEVILDEAGHPVMVPHYTAAEAEPLLGCKPHITRDKVRGGEWAGRLQPPRDSVYLSMRHIGINIGKMQADGSAPPGLPDPGDWPENPRLGVRGVVVAGEGDEAQEDAR